MDRLSKRTEEEEAPPQVKTKVKTKGGKADAIAAAGDAANVASWTVEEQKYLEKALLQYPKGALERWDKIAQMVPGRSKVILLNFNFDYGNSDQISHETNRSLMHLSCMIINFLKGRVSSTF